MVKLKINGFTLVELLIVMTIVVILSVILVGIINPIAMVDKANDALRKRDINRIKVAFEEYNNDKGCYPDRNLIISLNNPANCDSNTIFSPWLVPWPCGPTRDMYKVIGQTDPSTQQYVQCSKTFRVVTNLSNKTDSNIISGWYEDGYYVGGQENSISIGSTDVNYGVSSANILWYDRDMTGCQRTSCNVYSGLTCVQKDRCSGDGCTMYSDCTTDSNDVNDYRMTNWCHVNNCDCTVSPCVYN